MSTDIKNRQPKGIPAGGQFAPVTHSEPGTTLCTPPGVHAQAHAGLVGDQFNVHEESMAVRDSITEALAAGAFGDDAHQVGELAGDERLIRHAADRYVTAEYFDPGTFKPEDAGLNLGRLLISIHEEDLEDARNERETRES